MATRFSQIRILPGVSYRHSFTIYLTVVADLHFSHFCTDLLVTIGKNSEVALFCCKIIVLMGETAYINKHFRHNLLLPTSSHSTPEEATFDSRRNVEYENSFDTVLYKIIESLNFAAQGATKIFA